MTRRTDPPHGQSRRRRRYPGPTGDRTVRAQSEAVGVTILTGVVVVVALAAGAVLISASTGGDSAPATDFRLDATATDVLLTNNGGESLTVTELTVVLEQRGNEQRFTPASGDTSDGDARLVPGDRIRYAHGYSAGDLTAVVVHRPSNAVIFEGRVSVPA